MLKRILHGCVVMTSVTAAGRSRPASQLYLAVFIVFHGSPSVFAHDRNGMSVRNKTFSYPKVQETIDECGYFKHSYPLAHTEWRRQGRLIVLCSDTTGLGGYIGGLSAGLAVSILTERALILSCPYRHAALGLAKEMGNFFRGNRFDWSAEGLALPAYPQRVVIHRSINIYNRTYANGVRIEGDTFVLDGSEHRGLNSIIGKGGYGPLHHSTLQNISHVNWQMAGIRRCTTQAFFQPRHSLLRLQRRVLPDPIPAYMALHVRLGDSYMVDAEASKSDLRWRWAKEKRPSLMRDHPIQALACFERLSRERDLQQLVIADSTLVERVASKLGWMTTMSLGKAMVFGMRTLKGVTIVNSSAADIGKVFLDWWLLVNADYAMTFDIGGSTYLHTARWRRDDYNDSDEGYLLLRNRTALRECATDSHRKHIEVALGVCLLENETSVRGIDAFHC